LSDQPHIKKISNTLLIILKDCDPYFGVKQSKQLKVVTNGTTIINKGIFSLVQINVYFSVF